MAEITIERKPRRSVWPFVLAVLVLAAAAWAVWEFYLEPQREVAEAPATPGALEMPADAEDYDRGEGPSTQPAPTQPYAQPERPPGT